MATESGRWFELGTACAAALCLGAVGCQAPAPAFSSLGALPPAGAASAPSAPLTSAAAGPASTATPVDVAGPATPADQAATFTPAPVGTPTVAHDPALRAELASIPGFDLARIEEVARDLEQSDPALRPLLLAQLRTAAGYRGPAVAATPANGTGASPASEAPSRPQQPVIFPAAQPLASRRELTPPLEPLPPAAPLTEPPRVSVDVPGAPAPRVADEPRLLQAATAPSAGTAPAATGQPIQLVSHASVSTGPPVASPGRPLEGDWRSQVAAAIEQLERTSAGEAAEPDALRAAATLRMLYVLGGRRDDALRPIEGLPAAEQAYWTEQLYGLSTWLEGAAPHADAADRATRAREHLDRALASLSQASRLVVRNVHFCTKVESFGLYTPFAKPEFTPGQAFLLYAEVENFGHETTAEGHRTALVGSYQVFDARGNRVASETFELAEETCRTPRRDYFVCFRQQMPDRLFEGPHKLQLTIEDRLSNKLGQATIEFTVRAK